MVGTVQWALQTLFAGLAPVIHHILFPQWISPTLRLLKRRTLKYCRAQIRIIPGTITGQAPLIKHISTKDISSNPICAAIPRTTQQTTPQNMSYATTLECPSSDIGSYLSGTYRVTRKRYKGYPWEECLTSCRSRGYGRHGVYSLLRRRIKV